MVTTPARFLSGLELQGTVGQDADFDNARPGWGANVNLSFSLRPTNHLELRALGARRWLNVDTGSGSRMRLFTATVERIRATYTVSSRLFLRAIAQYEQTTRDPSLYVAEVARKEGSFDGSLLFAYKLNWETVLFLGWGDTREIDDNLTLQKKERQVFLKLSYAFQW